MKLLKSSAKWQILVLMASAFIFSLLIFGWLSLMYVQKDVDQVAGHQLVLTKHIARELDSRLESAQAALEVVADT